MMESEIRKWKGNIAMICEIQTKQVLRAISKQSSFHENNLCF